MALTSHEPGNELLSSLDKLFKEGTYSDLTIACGDDEYKVHKTVVCPRSLFFAKACSGPFEEGRTGIVALPDDDPQAVKLMILYLYYLDYPKGPTASKGALQTPNGGVSTTDVLTNWDWAQPAKARGGSKKKPGISTQLEREPGISDVPNLTTHAKVYALGEKYDIKGLKTVALEKFKKEANVHWDSDDFITAIEEVYTSTVANDRGMRNAVVEAIYEHHVNVLIKKPLQDAVRRLDLCFDLMMRFRSAY